MSLGFFFSSRELIIPFIIGSRQWNTSLNAILSLISLKLCRPDFRNPIQKLDLYRVGSKLHGIISHQVIKNYRLVKTNCKVLRAEIEETSVCLSMILRAYQEPLRILIEIISWHARCTALYLWVGNNALDSYRVVASSIN